MSAVRNIMRVERTAENTISAEGCGDRDLVECNGRGIECPRLDERQVERNRTGDGAACLRGRGPECGGHGVDPRPAGAPQKVGPGRPTVERNRTQTVGDRSRDVSG